MTESEWTVWAAVSATGNISYFSIIQPKLLQKWWNEVLKINKHNQRNQSKVKKKNCIRVWNYVRALAILLSVAKLPSCKTPTEFADWFKSNIYSNVHVEANTTKHLFSIILQILRQNTSQINDKTKHLISVIFTLLPHGTGLSHTRTHT